MERKINWSIETIDIFSVNHEGTIHVLHIQTITAESNIWPPNFWDIEYYLDESSHYVMSLFG